MKGLYETGWCGFGWARGQVSVLRLGWLQLTYTRDGLAVLIQWLRDAAAKVRGV